MNCPGMSGELREGSGTFPGNFPRIRARTKTKDRARITSAAQKKKIGNLIGSIGFIGFIGIIGFLGFIGFNRV